MFLFLVLAETKQSRKKMRPWEGTAEVRWVTGGFSPWFTQMRLHPFCCYQILFFSFCVLTLLFSNWRLEIDHISLGSLPYTEMKTRCVSFIHLWYQELPGTVAFFLSFLWDSVSLMSSASPGTCTPSSPRTPNPLAMASWLQTCSSR